MDSSDGDKKCSPSLEVANFLSGGELDSSTDDEGVEDAVVCATILPGVASSDTRSSADFTTLLPVLPFEEEK